jgi:hypothetical protein
MKYSQYDEVIRLLESDAVKSFGYSEEEWKLLESEEKVEQINEFLGMSLLGKLGLGAAASLLGLGIAFRKKLISAGASKIHLKQMKKIAEKFRKESSEGLKKAIQKLVDSKNRIKADAGVDTWKGLPKEKKQEVQTIERQIEKIFSQYIAKIKELKDKEIYQKIDDSKRLSDSHKMALKYAWETLTVDIQTGLLTEIMENKIIESPSIVEILDKRAKKQAEELKGDIADFTKKAKRGDDEKDKDNDKKTSINPDIKPGDKYILKHKAFSKDNEKPIEVEVEIIDKDEDGVLKFTWENEEGKEIKTRIDKDISKIIVKKVDSDEDGEGDIKDEKI